jgi:hypothetical protein
LDELHQQAVEHGAAEAEKRINDKAKYLKEYLQNPEVIGIFSGLPRFNLDDYKKVEARVTPEQLNFFVERYCGNAEIELRRDASGRLFSFKPTAKLIEIADESNKRDPYAATERIPVGVVTSATVDKEVAQGGARLLRFGDPVFEAMIRHVQYSEFSPVAAIELPAKLLGWQPRDEGTWILCELSISREDGKRKTTLRRELGSFVVKSGGEAKELSGLVDRVLDARSGGGRVDVEEAHRAYRLGRAAAEARLETFLEEVRAEHGTAAAAKILPEVTDLGLAWVRAE